jgi:hypothetical protein
LAGNLTTLAVYKATLDPSGFEAGAQRVEQSAKRVTAAVDGITEKTVKAGKDATQSAEGFQRFFASIDKNVGRAQEYQRAVDRLNSFQRAGVVSANEYAVAQESIRRKYQDLSQAQDVAAKGTANFGNALNIARGFLGAFGVALSVQALVQWGKSVIESASALGEQAQQIGVTTDALQAYRSVMELSGGKAAQMDQILARLNDRIGEAQMKSGAARDAFVAMGISANDVAGGPDRALPKLAQAALRIGNEQERVNKLNDIFGDKLGRFLLTGLRDYADGYDSVVKRAKELGVVLDKDLIKAADDAADRTALAFQRLKTATAPIIIWFTDSISSLVESFSQLGRVTGNPDIFPGTNRVNANSMLNPNRKASGIYPTPDGSFPASSNNGSAWVSQAEEAANDARLEAIEKETKARQDAADKWRKAELDAARDVDKATASLLATSLAAINTRTNAALDNSREYAGLLKKIEDDARDAAVDAWQGSWDKIVAQWDRTTRDLNTISNGFFDEFFDTGVLNFERLGASFKNIWSRALSDIITKQLNPLFASMAQGMQSILSGGSGGNIMGAIGGMGSLGAGLSGFGLGQVGNSILGGNQTNGMIGGAIGGIAGSVFGPLGSFAGSAIGSLIGGAFGPSKPSNYTAYANFGADYSVIGGLAGDKPNAQTTAAAQTAGQAIAQAAASLSAAGITLTQGVTRLLIGSRDASKLQLSSGGYVNVGAAGDVQGAVSGSLNYLLGGASASDANSQRVLDKYRSSGGINPSNLEALLNDVNFAKSLADLKLTGDELSEAEQALKAVTDQFDAVIERAKALGLEYGNIEQQRADAVAKLGQAMNTQAQAAIDQFINPTAAAYQAMMDEQEQRVKDAKVLGADVALIERRNDLERQAFLRDLNNEQRVALKGIVDLALDYTDAINLARRAALDAVDDQISAASRFANEMRSVAKSYQASALSLGQAKGAFLVGDLSALSPMDQYASARSQFSALAKKAVGGDRDAMGALPGLAQSFLTQSLNVNATNTQYGKDFSFVQDLLGQAQGSAQRLGKTYDAQAVAAERQISALEQIKEQLSRESPDADLLRTQIDLLNSIASSSAATALKLGVTGLSGASAALTDSIGSYAAIPGAMTSSGITTSPATVITRPWEAQGWSSLSASDQAQSLAEYNAAFAAQIRAGSAAARDAANDAIAAALSEVADNTAETARMMKELVAA